MKNKLSKLDYVNDRELLRSQIHSVRVGILRAECELLELEKKLNDLEFRFMDESQLDVFTCDLPDFK